MKILKRLNPWRRKFMRRLTQNVGTSNAAPIDLRNISIKRILVCRPNHRLGNMLLITPLIQEINTQFPDAKIDVFVKGNLASIVFENYNEVSQIIKLPKKHFNEFGSYISGWFKIKTAKYDLAVNVDPHSSSGRLAIKMSNAKYKFFGDANEDLALRYTDYRHIAKYPVYNFRHFLADWGLTPNAGPIRPVDIKLDASELAAGKIKLDALVPNEKKTICLFTFATGKKCYGPEWWEPLYKRLKIEFPNYNILEILPVENVSQINFTAPSYYSKYIREICAVIANTELFIGADSGMMHLASAAQTPTIGLFSVSNLKKYEPYANGSIAIDTNTASHDDYIKVINTILEQRQASALK